MINFIILAYICIRRINTIFYLTTAAFTSENGTFSVYPILYYALVSPFPHSLTLTIITFFFPTNYSLISLFCLDEFAVAVLTPICLGVTSALCFSGTFIL